ncbi:MAG: hypothetical protein ACYS80_15890, partial [Planctomycetota bacterium]
MSCKFQPVKFLYWVLGIVIVLGFAGGCSREHYKADADKEVYKIIDTKWQDDFGGKSNYIVSDANDPANPASPNDVEIA